MFQLWGRWIPLFWECYKYFLLFLKVNFSDKIHTREYLSLLFAHWWPGGSLVISKIILTMSFKIIFIFNNFWARIHHQNNVDNDIQNTMCNDNQLIIMKLVVKAILLIYLVVSESDNTSIGGIQHKLFTFPIDVVDYK